MATVECVYDNLPEPCVPDRIGPCPPEPSSSAPSSSDVGGCIRGFRNCPPVLLPGFRISILRYVYIPDSVDPDHPFIHSYHAWEINSDGKFNRVIADNNKSPAEVHWAAHKPERQEPGLTACASSSSSSSSSEATASTETLLPTSDDDLDGWAGSYTDIDEGVDTANESDVMTAAAGDDIAIVGMSDPTLSGPFTSMQLRLKSRQDTGVPTGDLSIAGLIDGSSVGSTSFTPVSHDTVSELTEFTITAPLGDPWTAAEIKTLQFRFHRIGASSPDLHVVAAEIVLTEDAEDDTAGAEIRFMGLQMRGEVVCLGDLEQPESSSAVTYSETKEVRFPAETFTCLDPDAEPEAFLLEDTDPALTNTISEVVLVFDSDGTVNKVFGGGETNCGTHDLKWHKHNPPTDTNTGFAITVVSQEEPGSALENVWGAWKLHFDSKGQFLYACAVVRFCGCEPTCSHPWCDSSDQQPFCVCRDLCLLTDGCQGIGSEPADCPGTVTIDCSIALITDCLNKILEAGNCVYTYTGQCRTCADEPSDTLISTVESSLTEGCFYPSGDSVIDCVTTNDPV